jgi:hypothetical protein
MGRRVVLLRVALQVRDERAAPARVHQLDGDQAVHGRPDEVRVGRRVLAILPCRYGRHAAASRDGCVA